MSPKNRFEDFSGLAPEKDRGSDRLRRVVQAALAVYLLPAAALVFAVGGVLIAVSGVAGGVKWVASRSTPWRAAGVTSRANRGAYRGWKVSTDPLGSRAPVSTTASRTGPARGNREG